MCSGSLYTSRLVKGQDAVSNPLMAAHFATPKDVEQSSVPSTTLLRNALYLSVIRNDER